MQRFSYAVALVILLAACQTLEHIGAEQGDPSYRTTTYSFTGADPGKVDLVYKLYEDEGQAAICGFLSGYPTLMGKTLTEKWFAHATIAVVSPDGEDTPLGYGEFLRMNKRGTTVYDGEARCVRSTVPWTEDFEKAVVVAKGPRRVTAQF